MPDQPRRCPVTGFDHHSAEHGDDPVGAYRRQRARAPVAWTEAHGGYWVVSDWAGMEQVATDDDTFSPARHAAGGDGLSVLIPKSPVAPHIPIESTRPSSRPTAGLRGDRHAATVDIPRSSSRCAQ